jgi:hypothetical protein
VAGFELERNKVKMDSSITIYFFQSQYIPTLKNSDDTKSTYIFSVHK